MYKVPYFRFYSHFPDLGERSINAMLDLCEDISVVIRKQAIKVSKQIIIILVWLGTQGQQ